MDRYFRRFIAVILLCVVLAGLGKLALASDYAARETMTRLEAAVGAPLRAQDVQLGYSGSTLRSLQVFETNKSHDGPAWTSVGQVDADLSLWQILTNDLGPGVVTLRDVAVTLSFDRENRLITRMPEPAEKGGGSMPLVRIENGTFTLKREGFADEVFHNIRLELKTEGEKQTLSGTVDDPSWGSWLVSGGRQTATGPFTLSLKTAKEVHATMPLLRRTPFVPPGTWRAVELEGDTSCEVTLRFTPDQHVFYKVELNPHDTKVYVPSIDLRADRASGRVVIEDDLLTLSNVRGIAAGGDVRLGSTMDFRNPTHVLGFNIETSQVNPRRMPSSWNVPSLDGRVEGKASITLAIPEHGPTITTARGVGTIKTLPLLPPIELHLKADRQGIRFGLGKG